MKKVKTSHKDYKTQYSTEVLYSSDSEFGTDLRDKYNDRYEGKFHALKSRNAYKSNDSGIATSRRGSSASRESSSLDNSSNTSFEKLHDYKIKEDNYNKSVAGFGHLPDQVSGRALRKGFEFSLMVVGASGLGKSTLVNSMFFTDIYARNSHVTDMVAEQTLHVETHNTQLEENGVKLSLTVIDTPGFGDAVDNSECWKPIVEYIDNQFDNYLEAETKVEREEVSDIRVHACLYFIAPTGHGLQPLDVDVMRKIHNKVNIIPVIGKADSCTQAEINLFKTNVTLKKLNVLIN